MTRSSTIPRVASLLFSLLMAGCSQGSDIENRTFDAEVRRVVVDVAVGDINVRGSQRVGAALLGEMYSDTAMSLGIDAKLVDDTLHVSANCPAGSGECWAGLRLDVPQHAEVSIAAGHGDVDVTDLLGDLHVSTGAGSVVLLGVGGTVRVEADGGDVMGANLLRGDTWATSESGDISLAFAEPPLVAGLGSVHGTVSLTVPRSQYDLFVDSVEGELDIGVHHCRAADQQLFARSVYGDVLVHH
ncbi:MAG: hypothetical protein B7733_08740 [Myxococcales bacterium FL481]|nr:MAG: hypothetical protein B7733_08740 [Myxococcales bacterium FL481]